MFKHLWGKIVKGAVIKEIAEKNGLYFIICTFNNLKDNDKFQYIIGENSDSRELVTNSWNSGGLRFTTIERIHDSRDVSNGFHVVTFSDDEDIFVDDYIFKAKTITISVKYYVNALPIDKFCDILNCNIPIGRYKCENYVWEDYKSLFIDRIKKKKSTYLYLTKQMVSDPDIKNAYFDNITNKEKFDLYQHCLEHNKPWHAGTTNKRGIRRKLTKLKKLTKRTESALEMLILRSRDLGDFVP
jgi:hypothetical protein